jgi:hypothetical protein
VASKSFNLVSGVAPAGAVGWHQHGCMAASQQGGVGWVTGGGTVAVARVGVRRGGNGSVLPAVWRTLFFLFFSWPRSSWQVATLFVLSSWPTGLDLKFDSHKI